MNYRLNLYPTPHQNFDGNYLLQHQWTCQKGDSWAHVPAPPISRPNHDQLSVAFFAGSIDIEGSVCLHLTASSPVGRIEKLESDETEKGTTYLFGCPVGIGSPSTDGTFTFNALIKAKVNGENRTYKADPEMVVSNNGGGNPWPRG